MRALVLMFLLVPTLSGCVAMKSQMWSRAEDDNLYPDSEKPIRGLPVMLKVPSHIEVVIRETLYATHEVGATPEKSQVKVIKLARPDLEVDAQLKYTEKMFVVDPVRVASGTGSYGFGFSAPDKTTPILNANGASNSGHGYLHTLDYKADDKTITTSATLLQSILSFNTPEAANKKSFVENFGVIEIKRVVAFHRFDLGSPTVDEEIHAFLQEHMNCCNQCNELGRSVSSASVQVQEASPPLELTEE